MGWTPIRNSVGQEDSAFVLVIKQLLRVPTECQDLAPHSLFADLSASLTHTNGHLACTKCPDRSDKAQSALVLD